jgi:hypothetical protein
VDEGLVAPSPGIEVAEIVVSREPGADVVDSASSPEQAASRTIAIVMAAAPRTDLM